VSKRSFRRLAVVAGAALAVGSVAPAMAAISVGGSGAGAADASVTVPSLPAPGSIIPTGLLTGAQAYAGSTVSGAKAIVFGQVSSVQTDVSNIVGSLLDAATGLSADLTANAHASSGGVAIAVNGLGNVDSGLLSVVPTPDAALAGAQSTVGSVAGFGIGTATGALSLVNPGVVLGSATGLLGTATGLVDAVSLTANASTAAALVGIL
jgi:hypothetical protein